MRPPFRVSTVLGFLWVGLGLCGFQGTLASAQAIGANDQPDAPLMSLIGTIRHHAEARNDALSRSRGSCTIRLLYVAGEDRPEEDRKLDPADFDFSTGRTAEIAWKQRGADLRYDKKVSAGGHYSLPAQNERVLIGPKQELCYDVESGAAYVDNAPPSAWNPSAIVYRFEPALLFPFRGLELHEQMLRSVEAGILPALSHVERDGEPLIKIEYRWEPGDRGRERKGSQQFLVAPKRGYSLLEAVYTNQFFHEGEPRGETFAHYTAEYSESPVHAGIWLHDRVRYLTYESGTLDAIEVDFGEVEVGVDLPDGDFAEESLRIPPEVAVVDRRLLHYSGK